MSHDFVRGQFVAKACFNHYLKINVILHQPMQSGL